MSNRNYTSADEQLSNKLKHRGKVRIFKGLGSKIKNIKLNKKAIVIVSVAAGATVGLVALTSTFANITSKNNKTNNLSTSNSTSNTKDVNNTPENNTNNSNNPGNGNTSNSSNSTNTSNSNNNPDNKKEQLKTDSINSLGVELELPKKETPKVEYSNPTGNVKVDDIVEDSTGKLWANSEAESKKDEIDKVVIDDNNGQYEISSDGDVYEKEPGYQIVDSNGNVTSEGTSDIMDDYSWDPEVGKYLPKDEVGKYVIAPDGNMWKKGEYEKYLESLKNDNTSPTIETEFIPMDSVIADTEFVPIDNDILTSSGTIVSSNKNDNTSLTSNSQVTSDDEITLDGGKTMPNGTYDVGGLVFESKEDYEQWILQDFEGYGIINGIMVPKNDEMLEADRKALTR